MVRRSKLRTRTIMLLQLFERLVTSRNHFFGCLGAGQGVCPSPRFVAEGGVLLLLDVHCEEAGPADHRVVRGRP